MKKIIITLIVLFMLTLFPYKSLASVEMPSIVGDVASVGLAFLVNLVVHETGHAAVANHVGADGIGLHFMKKHGNKFFLGLSYVDHIDEKSRLPYSMGGEVAASYTFEYALSDYRHKPTTYNKALMFFSGTDFLWYSAYAFYLTDGDKSFDPNAVTNITGLSEGTIFSVALAQSLINAYRVYSGQDYIVPYFTVDKYSAVFNIRFAF
jgi:hypothetical protein